MSTTRILHYPGSKWSMADWIISHMPDHQTYCEPFFGSGSVLFRKKASRIETVNDLDGNVVNLFKVIRDRPEELAHAIRWTPYAREEYYASYDDVKDDIERARRFLVRMWQAIGAKTSDRTGWRSDISVDTSYKPKEWVKLPDKILSVTERLKEVQIENQYAEMIVDRYRRPDVLLYCDPPYLLSTRSKRLYKHEMMSEEEHIRLLDQLEEHPGPVLLSGYANELYENRLRHWNKQTKWVAAESGKSRMEVLWMNPAAANQTRQLTLF
ncbi:DNA adenine methylase [Paenibacillus sp. HB172176]|uniref:DNA adenine methylase n=1 Tax=Paenibacillus sp. HB172176 TaxID=2493690 RepID=UPI001438F6F1|nr:DNA adenine methylase [Paenibacillus sp. HB172176]